MLGLVGARGVEPEVELADLEDNQVNGKLADWVAKNHDPSSGKGTVTKWQGRIDGSPDERVVATLAQACHGNADILRRVEPFASLLRTDPRGVALVFLSGDVYVTETANRRDTGTAYTTPEFAAEIAEHALKHLIWEPGPHNEEDPTKWRIRSPEEILELRVCDPAVGSGAILVAAVRYMADELVESRLRHGELSARDLETAAADPVATDPSVQARRDVVSRCIYAVDRDPMAVEMAKLSLWLITMAQGRPFTFLDHAIKCGDSLLGITSLDQLRQLCLDESAGTQIGLDLEGGRVEGLGDYFAMIDESIGEVVALREGMGTGDVVDAADARRRSDLLERSESHLSDLRLFADAITAVCYVHSDRGNAEVMLRERVLPLAVDLDQHREELQKIGSARPSDAPEHWPFLHWPLDFTDVFIGGGFDAVVGNPPFIRSQGMKEVLGSSYRDYCVTYLADGRRGKADLIGYFALRVFEVAQSAGLIATKSIGQGDTLAACLAPLLQSRTLYRAVKNVPWPGGGVHVAKLWVTELPWVTGAVLDGVRVAAITPSLEPAGKLEGPPQRLRGNRGKAFQGFQVIARGFEITEAQAAEMIAADHRSTAIIRPLANGETLHDRPEVGSQRRVIDFGTSELAEAKTFEAPFAYVSQHVQGEVLEKARPRPDGRASSYAKWKERWWQFWSPRAELRAAIQGMERVIAMVGTSKVFYPRFVPANYCLTHSFVVFAYDDDAHFAILSSSFHWWWAIAPPGTGGSSFKSDPRYTTSNSFETFPQPDMSDALGSLGQAFDVFRESVMKDRQIGLRELYGLVHSRDEASSDVGRLRELHHQIDQAVLASYMQTDPDVPWQDIGLDLGFHDCGSLGERYTLGESDRRVMLQRLLECNLRRYAREHSVEVETVLSEARGG